MTRLRAITDREACGTSEGRAYACLRLCRQRSRGSRPVHTPGKHPPDSRGPHGAVGITRRTRAIRVRLQTETTFDLDEYAYDALRAGASGFLLKDAQPGELVAGVRAVAAGDAVISPSLTRKLLDAFSNRLPGHSPGQRRRLEDLTPREREVLTAIASGWTNLEIAERLHLAESTVKSHIGRILTKIGARDRVQAVIFAYDTGLVQPV
ncbi:LuxR C-terminal-related transcriptional regulator [Streptomyces tauricus]